MRKILRFPRSRPAAADFESLLRPHVEYLYRLAYRFTGRVEDAEDLVQDLLVKLYPRLHELNVLEQPRPWLARVLYRQFIDMTRRRGDLNGDFGQEVSGAARERADLAGRGYDSNITLLADGGGRVSRRDLRRREAFPSRGRPPPAGA